jgi:luciferase family oxidoreductase group 1
MIFQTISYLDDAMPADHPFAALGKTLPTGGGRPEVWLLGSSPDSAQWAGEAGLPYCIADFINPEARGLASLYRQNFRPSAHLDSPYVMVATWTIAAPTQDEAEQLALPAAMMFAHLVRGELIAVPSVEKARGWLAAGGDPIRRRRRVLGTPAEVHTGLDAVAADYGADELMLVNILPDHAARVRSYALVAHEYGLVPLAVAA